MGHIAQFSHNTLNAQICTPDSGDHLFALYRHNSKASFFSNQLLGLQAVGSVWNIESQKG